jgi:hypothetical protein
VFLENTVLDGVSCGLLEMDAADGGLETFVQSRVFEQVTVVGSEIFERGQGFVKVRHPLIMQTFVRVSNA